MTKIITDEIKKNNILEAMLTGKNIQEVATISGVSRKTIYDYINNDTKLLIKYRDLKRNQIRELSETLSELALSSINNIQALAEDENTPPNVKLQAHLKIIELFMSTRMLENNINRNVYGENKSEWGLDDGIEKYITD